jgi:hypothetical protein
MGLPVTVYRYTDAGAPQLVNNTPSEWINVLKKVLVEGYGDKQPLGWTLEFEDAATRSIAFRNATTVGGSGGYVKFYSSDGTNTANKSIAIKCAMGMTDINTFFKPLWVRGLSPVSTHKGWEIIGTKRGFYLILHATNSNKMALSGVFADTQVFFIGDIHSVIVNDTAPFTFVTGNSATSDSISSEGITGYSGTTLSCQLYALDGTVTSLMHTFSRGLFYKGNTSDGGDAESLSINHLMSPIYIYGSNTQNNTTSMPQGRGIIPGLYLSSFAGYRTTDWPKELLQGIEKFILLRSYGSPQLWISTGEWYD